MIITLLLGLVLVGTAVAFVSPAVLVARPRTPAPIGRIGPSGFAGHAGPRPTRGLRGFPARAAAARSATE